MRFKLERLLESNQKAFQEFGALLGGEAREEVEGAINKAQKELGGESSGRLQDALQSLTEASRLLSEVIMYSPKMPATEPKK